MYLCMKNRIKMKKRSFILLMAAAFCGIANAQNEWEEMDRQQEVEEAVVKVNPDEKYLAGAVPMVDGRVTFSTVIEAPGKSASQIYSIVKNYMDRLTRQPNQLEHSVLALADSSKNFVCGNYQEWLVFKSNALVLDRTRFYYSLIANCSDGRLELKMTRIYYLYEEERDPQTYRAEEWIDDDNALNKKKNKLSKMSGKFRRKTIDRKDYLFGKFYEILNGKKKEGK